MKVEKNRFRVPVEIASHCDVTRNYISLRRTWNTRRASSQNNYGRGSEITVLQIDRKKRNKDGQNLDNKNSYKNREGN